MTLPVTPQQGSDAPALDGPPPATPTPPHRDDPSSINLDSRRRPMPAGHQGMGDPRPGSLPQPSSGLRLRSLPASSGPTFPLDHEYFEIVYAPLLGPTAVLVARAMSRHLESTSGPATVCPLDLALEVGIRASDADPLGKKSHLVRALDRLAHDRIVVRLDDRVLGVHQRVPPLGRSRLDRLPRAVRDRHEEILLALEGPDSSIPLADRREDP